MSASRKIKQNTPKPGSQFNFSLDNEIRAEDHQSSLESVELNRVKNTQDSKEDDYDDEGNDDISLLSRHSSRKSWLQWATDAIRNNLLTPIQLLGSYLKQHPILLTLAIGNALTTIVNSLLYAIQTKPENLSAETWEESSSQRKWLAGVLMAASFGVNVILGVLFLPKAKTLFSKKTWTEHPFRAITSLGLGSAAAFSMAALTYETFGFSIAAALSMAGFSLPINFATRFASVESGEKRVYNKFINSDTRFQTKYINSLKNIKEEYKKDLNIHLSNILMNDSDSNPEKFYEELLLALQRKVNEMHDMHPNMYKRKVNAQCCKEFGGLAFDLTLATFIAFCAYLIFAQKGHSGFVIVDKWINGKNSTTFDDLSEILKIAEGSASGAASGFLYLFSALDIRTVTAKFASQMITNPKQLPFGLLLITACVLSGSAMLNVAQGVANNTKGIFKSLIDHFPTAFIVGGASGGAIVNAKSAILQAYPEKLDTNHVTVQKIINLFENSNDHPLSKETLQALRTNSVFTSSTGSNDVELATSRYKPLPVPPPTLSLHSVE